MEEKKENKWVLPRMSDKDLKSFVLSFCDGRIFTSNDIAAGGYDSESNMYTLVFMPLAFMEWNKAPKGYLESIGLVWEHMSKAGPRAINGMPMFLSCHFMHVEDWERARKAIQKELKRREEVEV